MRLSIIEILKPFKQFFLLRISERLLYLYNYWHSFVYGILLTHFVRPIQIINWQTYIHLFSSYLNTLKTILSILSFLCSLTPCTSKQIPWDYCSPSSLFKNVNLLFQKINLNWQNFCICFIFYSLSQIFPTLIPQVM